MARLRVEVVQAFPDRQEVKALDLGEGTTAGEAVRAAGFDAGLPLGIAGRRIAVATPLRNGDRVELLRPLAADPKEARRQRARKARRR